MTKQKHSRKKELTLGRIDKSLRRIQVLATAAVVLGVIAVLLLIVGLLGKIAT